MPDIYIKDTTGLSQTYSGVMSVAFRLASNMSAYADYYYGGGDTFGDAVEASTAAEQTRQFKAVAPFITRISSYTFCYKTINGTISFSNCSQLGYKAFASAQGDHSLYMPNVTSLGNDTFVYDYGLKYIYLPNFTGSLPYEAFNHCNYLTSIDTGATVIGISAFSGCIYLATVPNASNITQIGGNGFGWCTRLSGVLSLPKCLSLGYDAFNDASYITHLYAPSCTYVGNGAFNDCYRLYSVWLPNVTTISSSAFYNCSALAEAYMGISYSSVITLYKSVFRNTKIAAGQGSIFVPSSLLTAYKAAANWSEYSNYIYAYGG